MDVERVLVAEPKVASFAEPVPPRPPSGQPAVTMTQPAIPASTLRDPSDVHTKDIPAMIADAQRRAYQSLARRLRRFYEDEARRFEIKQRDKLDASRERQYQQAQQSIRTAFDALAKLRAPKLMQLSLLAGFPDPNPDSTPPQTKMRPAFERRFNQERSLRSDIASLDDEFRKEVDRILGQIDNLLSEQRVQMALAAQDFKSKLDARAEEEARSEVQRSNREIELRLVKPAPITLPPVAARPTTIPGTQSPAPAPRVTSENVLDGPAGRRTLVEHQLTIWLGLNHYVRAKTLKGGPDQTQEFSRWRAENQLGP